MPNCYDIPDLPPQGVHCCEQTIQRSRFIATFAHTPHTESARAFIEHVRKDYADATHNCWAFAAGSPGQTAQAGYSDDGEPHGTAGRPMLSMLLYGAVGEVSVVVTRYFGGIKLGTGGLVRAYQGMVKLGLETLPRREHMVAAQLEVVLAYGHITLFRRLLPTFRATVDVEHFGVDATYMISLPEENIVPFTQALTELADGAVLVEQVKKIPDVKKKSSDWKIKV